MNVAVEEHYVPAIYSTNSLVGAKLRFEFIPSAILLSRSHCRFRKKFSVRRVLAARRAGYVLEGSVRSR